MTTKTLQLTDMAHGGSAIAKDKDGFIVFVPFGIPGERVKARIVNRKRSFAQAELIEVLDKSPDRQAPRCPHFGVCGSCHFQHIRYERQLEIKRNVVQDQFERIGGFKRPRVQPTLPNPEPWAYQMEIVLSPTNSGGLGYWSPYQRRVFPVEACPIAKPQLVELLHDIDLDLPELRKLTLRMGDDEALLAAMEVQGVEPPQLAADFPVSVAIVLPDNTAASLVGDNHTVQQVKGRDFRISSGCFFYPSPAAAELLVETVLRFADLSPRDLVLEGYGGVGTLTSFLADAADAVVMIEQNPDAVADAAVNLEATENVSVVQETVEVALPAIDEAVTALVVHPPADGLSREAVTAVCNQNTERLIYVSSDVATLARDGKQLRRGGYRLVDVQPIDVMPHNFQVDTVSLWRK